VAKFLLIILGAYLVFRFVIRPPKAISAPQEPDLFIDHEEVKKEHEKN